MTVGVDPEMVNEATTPRGEGGVRAVTRALTLLEVFDSSITNYTVAALARRVGLPRTTTIRLVDTLVEEGMLQYADDGSVGVGTRLITWGALAAAAWTVPPATIARMREVADETGETVSVYVRNGLHRTVIGQVQSRHTLRHVVQIGDELPLWSGAAAVVLLSMEPQDDRDRLVRRIADASEGRVSAEALAAQVEQARATGYAVSHGGREPGNSGIAVPVGSNGAPTAPRIPVVLALGGPTVRFREDAIPGFLAALRRAAADVATAGLPAALY